MDADIPEKGVTFASRNTSHRSDKAQRELIRSLAKISGVPEEAGRVLKKLLDRLDEVSIKRNLAAHTIFGLSMFDPETGAYSPKVVTALPPEHNKRLEEDFRAQFQAAETELRDIYRGLDEWLIHTPYPPRPWGLPAILGATSGALGGSEWQESSSV